METRKGHRGAGDPGRPAGGDARTEPIAERPPPDRRAVWLLNLGLAGAAGALFVVRVRSITALGEPSHIPWSILAATFLVAEVWVVHLEFRRETLSFTLNEIPLVLGLFFATPTELVLAQLTGAAVGLVLHRRQPVVKVVFNLCLYGLNACLAVVVFRALTEAPAAAPAVWPAAFLATLAATLVGALAITAAMSLADGRFASRPLVTGIALGASAALINTSVALIGVELLEHRPHALWLLVAPALTLFFAYRGSLAQRRVHRSVQFLYECTQVLQRSEVVERGIREVLRLARSTFRSEVAEITYFPASGDRHPVRITIGVDDGEDPADPIDLEAVDLEPGDPAKLLEAGRPAFILTRSSGDEALRTWAAARGIRDAMVAPLLANDRFLGCVIVANRLGDVAAYERDDLRLIQTVATHVAVALERAGLMGRLARSLVEVTRLASIVDSSTDAIIGLSKRGVITTWNPGAERTFGYTASEAVDRPISILLPSEGRVEGAPSIESVLGGARFEQLQTEFLAKTGARVSVSVTAWPVGDAAGRVTGAWAIVRDVSERRRRDEALRESEERFRRVFEEGPVGMCLLSPDLRPLKANDALCSMLGYAEHELARMPLAALLHPDEAERSLVVLETLMAGTVPAHHAEQRLVTKEGEVIVGRMVVWPIHDPEGTPAYALAMVEDVTEQKQAKERLARVEARFRRAVLSMTAVQDPARVLQAVVDTALELVDAEYSLLALVGPDGVTLESFVQSGMSGELVDEIGQPHVGTGVLGNIVREGKPVRLSNLAEHPEFGRFPEGHPPMSSLVAVPLVYRDRTLGFLFLTNKRGDRQFGQQDTEIAQSLAAQAAVAIQNARVHARNRELLERLHQVSAELRRASENKSQFIANMSHELRTPLDTILIAADMLHDPSLGPLPEERVRDWSGRIQADARHVLDLISDLVDLSKIEAGRLDLRPRPVELAPLLAEVRLAVEPLAADKGIELTISPPTSVRALADPLRLRQVLLNLLTNAIKFTGSGGTVRVDAVASGDEGVAISVHDTGVGIAHKDFRRILEPFERAAEAGTPGTGLGLAITKRIVELHGGRLDIVSTKGAGSTFTVTLPSNQDSPRGSTYEPAAGTSRE